MPLSYQFTHITITVDLIEKENEINISHEKFEWKQKVGARGAMVPMVMATYNTLSEARWLTV